MKILSVTDAAFKKYGKVVDNVDFSGIYEVLRTVPVTEEVVYVPAVEELEALPVKEVLSDISFGKMPIQIGYCIGHNSLLNAVEYHRNSEIDAAATDMILLLGCQQDIEDDFTYDTAKMEAFLVPAGTAVELYATTLHYAPCGVNGEGFKMAVVLPQGTNYPLTEKRANPVGEDMLLKESNKWLIAHPEAGLEAEAFVGLKGKNLNVNE